jgi:hypothetical protein
MFGDFSESTFFSDTVTLLQVIVPAAICFTLWRLFVTNRYGPRGDVVVLGLDDSHSVYSELDHPQISRCWFPLYCFTGLLTFSLGLLAFEFWQFLQTLMIRLLE